MKSRALKLVQDELAAPPAKLNADDDLIEVRVLGRVAAGLPLYAEENVIDTVRVDRMLVRGRAEVFGLRVTGDSMIDAGILSGDYIFVKKQSTADRGDIVVALIGDEATVNTSTPSGTTCASSQPTAKWRRSWCAPATSSRRCCSAKSSASTAASERPAG